MECSQMSDNLQLSLVIALSALLSPLHIPLPVDETHGAGAGAGGDELILIQVAIVADAAEHSRGSLAS